MTRQLGFEDKVLAPETQGRPGGTRKTWTWRPCPPSDTHGPQGDPPPNLGGPPAGQLGTQTWRAGSSGPKSARSLPSWRPRFTTSQFRVETASGGWRGGGPRSEETRRDPLLTIAQPNQWSSTWAARATTTNVKTAMDPRRAPASAAPRRSSETAVASAGDLITRCRSLVIRRACNMPTTVMAPMARLNANAAVTVPPNCDGGQASATPPHMATASDPVPTTP